MLADGRDLTFTVFEDKRQLFSQLPHTFADHNPVFAQQSADLIDQGRPFVQMSLTYTLEHLDILLLDGLDWNKAHTLP